MLDLTIYKTRYYEVKVDENVIIHLEMPKKKQLKTIMSLTKSLNGDILNEEDIVRSLYCVVPCNGDASAAHQEK